MTPATDQSIAETFVRLLRDELTAAQFAEMQRRNSTPEYVGCCASHDFCDANMIMAAAFEEHGFATSDDDDQFATARWNRVWNLAMPTLTKASDPDICPHCGNRNTNDLAGTEHECYDCGQTYNTAKEEQ